MTLLEAFRFIDPGPLVDRDLELVTPADRWVDELLRTLGHLATRALMPREAALTRDQLTRFVRDYPLGRQNADGEKGMVPAYHFWMRVRPGWARSPAVVIAGGIGFRVGRTRNLEMYLGNIGYNVFPPARGQGYARRAVQLLLPLAKRVGINPVWVTCNPDNVASRRSIEGAGGVYVETVELPEDHALYGKGVREKCRYRIDL
jgi:predicted acetyltransferase